MGLFHAAAMATRERDQVHTNNSKMASNEMETPVFDDNKNLNFNNIQTPSPSVWSKRLHKVPNISFGWVEEFCKKTFDLPKKIQLICRQTQIFRRRLRFSDSDFFEPLFVGLIYCFFRYLSKTDAPEHLRLYLKHICAVLLFLDFPGKLPLCCKREQFFGHIHFLTPWIRPI